MRNILSKEQKQSLINYIQTELLKRGFNSKVEHLEQKGNCIDFCTEEFQTTPVIFKSIRIGSFSTNVKEDKIELENGVIKEVIKVWITVNTRTESFSGGTNGTELFQFNTIFIKGGERMFKTSLS